MVGHSIQDVARIVDEIRHITIPSHLLEHTRSEDLLEALLEIKASLEEIDRHREAEVLGDVYQHAINAADFGGLALSPNEAVSGSAEAEVLFLLSAYLEGLNSADRQAVPIKPLQERPHGRRGMTLAEKILAAHDVERRGEVKPGDVIRVDIDWIMASELSWSGMEKTYNEMGQPGIFRNDRIWLAGDHIVDPRIKDQPKIKSLIDASERAKSTFKLSEYQGMNYTIMHTEFCRERAQPGMLVIGSDSHTCSAGSVSALAIGLGVADVTMPMITGKTWFKVPETVEIRFVGVPQPGLGGKDVILYVLQQLKRNTVAADRIVEYNGPGLKHLSCDARFAIANMTTEFGGVTGIFVPDETTFDFINKRKNPKYKRLSTYYKPDEDARYVECHIIDLSKVESFVARYPSPDDVVPVSEVGGTKLDGCFIGACTTAREDLILAALVLEAGLKHGLRPVSHGKRKVVPGSRPIAHNLRELGLMKIYEDAGFEIGVPGCSYCVGMSADKAGKGEVWLSSQNRNFENRMGPGAIGSISSAVTVAASSFDMSITDPKPLLDAIDLDRLTYLLGFRDADVHNVPYMEPGTTVAAEKSTTATTPALPSTSNNLQLHEEKPPASSHVAASAPSKDAPAAAVTPSSAEPTATNVIRGRVQTLGNFVDTDALAPAEAITNSSITTEELGRYCLVHTNPEFRNRVRDEGMNIVVAGHAFGVGSSRENAVTALQGAGVQCVIAKSFAFIYGRNQPNLGLLGFVIKDEEFHEMARDGVRIEIDVDARVVRLSVDIDGGHTKGDDGSPTARGEKKSVAEWKFELSPIEEQLWRAGGMSKAFQRWGKKVLEIMTGSIDGREDQSEKQQRGSREMTTMEEDVAKKELRW